MHKAKKHLRFFVALTVLSSAFFISIRFSDRGVQLDLKQSSGASAATENKRYNLSALKVLNSVLLHLKDSYVEPERINPSKMLVSALEEIQNSIPEVVIHHDGAQNKGVASNVEVHVSAKKKSFEVQGIASLWEMSFKLKEIFTFIESSLEDDPDIKFQDIEYAAINGMLSSLDPHSTLLPPQNYQDMQTQTGGKFGAHVIRAVPGADSPGSWHTHDLDFQLVYVTKGWVEFEYEGQGLQMLRAGSCVLQPAGIRHREVRHSDDMELIEVVSPAEFATHDAKAPA